MYNIYGGNCHTDYKRNGPVNCCPRGLFVPMQVVVTGVLRWSTFIQCICIEPQIPYACIRLIHMLITNLEGHVSICEDYQQINKHSFYNNNTSFQTKVNQLPPPPPVLGGYPAQNTSSRQNSAINTLLQMHVICALLPGWHHLVVSAPRR